MSAQQQVIKIDDISEENAPAIYVAGGLGQFFDAVAAEVTAEVPDLTTRKGRERIASLAAKVSKSKTAVEKPGRDYLKRLKEMPKVVEAELRDFVNKMDALRDATRQPLTDWEQAEIARTDAHVDAIQQIKDLAIFETAPTSSHLASIIADLELLEIGDSWEEFLAEAAQVKDQTLIKLRTLHAERARYEAEQAELIRLRAEAEAQAQRDRDAQIAREAEERTRREAEQRAHAEREAAARREQELLDQAAAAQRAAEQAARDAEAQAERQRLQLEQQAEQARLAAEQAEANRIAAEQRAEQERQAAAKRAEQAAEQARADERRRADAAAAEIVRQQQAREADLEHKKQINRAALNAFIEGGMTEECAKQAITLIAHRKIPAISISY
jgi:DNA polymerase III gamma/tau subunit